MENERERAAFYQAHKDDEDVWEEVEPPKPRKGRPSKGLKATITVRFTEEEADIIRREAQATGATYSEVVRNAIRAKAAVTAPQATELASPEVASGAG